jgi:hypothetical protein
LVHPRTNETQKELLTKVYEKMKKIREKLTEKLNFLTLIEKEIL